MNTGMFFEFFDEWEIRGVIGFLEDVLEIAAGLMRMNEQSEMETPGHRDSFFLSDHDNKPCEFMNSCHGGHQPSTHHGRTRQTVRNG
jgi:hypothetical protein